MSLLPSSFRLGRIAAPGLKHHARQYATLFENQPQRPDVHTVLPGPLSVEGRAKLGRVFDTGAMRMLVDYERSQGNYIVDADQNQFLDTFSQIASIAVGYNNPHVAKAITSPEMVRAMVNRPALGNFPSTDMADILTSGLLKAAPPGLSSIFTASTGSDANETAYKAAFIWRRAVERGDVDFTPEEIASSMNNKAPGAPEYSIMSFDGGFHGRTFGSLATTRSKAIHKLDVPSFDWPSAPFPKLQYPLDQFAQENAAEEERCIHEVERIIDSNPKPVAAVVVEPIQSEGGDNHASANFFRELRRVTERRGVLLIVDEVQTGVGPSGKFWAHEHWNLPSPPDMVTFSKKAQAAGFYYGRKDLRPKQPYRQFNTWMGDPARALVFKAILEEISRLNLVDNAAQTGKHLFDSLEALAKKYPHEILNLRGKDRGTFIAWDSPRRDDVISKALRKGILIGGSGARAIRLRPMLIFQKQHADMLVETLESILRDE
ncbi:hypothetical protein D0863_11034 [Hortaea werneckii]|uniref:4-aminobutyrate aminotransferase n=1 Tax=Hortaea werneckii TaxID=91943 RepID=A0A3M7DD86_HORWE|nr:hypothetical protein D0863_11034 [Hortaea werneckii]